MGNAKHIFIGLGGSGCQTVSQIKEKVYAKRFPSSNATKSRLEAMNASYRFLFIDTDSRDIEEANKKNRDSFEYGKVPFISPQKDLIALGRANPQAIYYEAKQDPETLINKRILEACSQELSVKIPDQPLQFGAGAFRMKSRIAFAHSLTDFQTKLQSAISELNDVKTVGGEDCTIFYWVVCSTLGGTGSGIFNDVLYYVNQLHRQIVGDGDPQLVLTMFMPKVYIDSNATEEKYALNAFGVFSELEAFKGMSYNDNQKTVMHRMAFANDYNLIHSDRRYCPFYYLIPIDVQTDKGTSLGNTRTMYRNTAEMLYHLHAGQGGDTFRSDIDNYMNDIMEKEHKNFLVPMGYVALQKPNDQFKRYFATRFKRDILQGWFINEKAKDIDDKEVEALYKEMFRYFSPSSDSAASQLLKNIEEVKDAIDSINTESNILEDQYKLAVIESDLDDALVKIKNEKDKREEHITLIKASILSEIEKMIIAHGITYTINAVEKVKDYAKELYNKFEGDSDAISRVKLKGSVEELYSVVQAAESEAIKIDLSERLKKNNKEDIQSYQSKLSEWVDSKVNLAVFEWKYDILREFCNDDKNDILSKIRAQLARFEDKAKEMAREASNSYGKLATTFGDTALDVTTVYLPMLKDICDANGWKIGNFFSKLYELFIKAQTDKAETPDRQSLTDFLSKHIYNTENVDMKEEITKDQYIVTTKRPDPKHKGQEIFSEETRFFTKDGEDRLSEKILEDFIRYAQKALDREAKNNKDVQEKWDGKKISSFFADLTNDQKDDVRKSLNPALFFNYNNQRIDVVKKEEHIVFVAGSEDLATEMLGYDRGNPKHRFERGDDENSALVLKSKFGLSLADYRMYDSIKMVYDKASFREKYHFHHDFAQFRDKITLEDLPDEVLNQHRTFAKILILDKFKDELKPLFYSDEYDPDLYVNSMYIPEVGDFKIARPEAFSMKESKICLRLKDKGREFYQEIEGKTFSDQFAKYSELYYNQRYGETLNSIIMEIQHSNKKLELDGKEVSAETLLKNLYEKKQKELLAELRDLKNNSLEAPDRRLYNILFSLVREKYITMHDFVGK